MPRVVCGRSTFARNFFFAAAADATGSSRFARMLSLPHLHRAIKARAQKRQNRQARTGTPCLCLWKTAAAATARGDGDIRWTGWAIQKHLRPPGSFGSLESTILLAAMELSQGKQAEQGGEARPCYTMVFICPCPLPAPCPPIFLRHFFLVHVAGSMPVTMPPGCFSRHLRSGMPEGGGGGELLAWMKRHFSRREGHGKDTQPEKTNTRTANSSYAVARVSWWRIMYIFINGQARCCAVAEDRYLCMAEKEACVSLS